MRKYPLKVLDAGCGDGNNLVGLVQAAERLGINLDLVAADYNPVRAKRVKDQGLADKVFCGDLLRMPFPDSSFDLIICNHVLEHIQDYTGALHELRRLLSAGGLLLLGVPNEGCLMARLRNHVFQRSILKHTDHVNFFTAKSLEKSALAAHFQIDSMFHFGFFSPHYYLHTIFMKFPLFRKLNHFMGDLLPSQCSDLQAILRPG